MTTDSRTVRVLLLMAGATLAGRLAAQTPSRQPPPGMAMWLVNPDSLKWIQIRPGNEMAVVYGDPAKAGELYAVRFRFADGFQVPPQRHGVRAAAGSTGSDG